ncbi:MAG TPA: hypothetical protein VJG66_00600 [Patescibacteria group bacterium]|nr:hypothetical protein [Patescibacteria group bacterium]
MTTRRRFMLALPAGVFAGCFMDIGPVADLAEQAINTKRGLRPVISEGVKLFIE